MKNTIKSLIFIILLFIIIEAFSLLFLPSNKIKKYGYYDISAYEILGEKENTIDVIFLGDSLIYSSISPMRIWKDYGFTSFDCAEPAHIISANFKYLEAALQNQKPKIVFMESNVLFRDERKYSWQSKVTREYKNYFSIIKYHNNWKNYIQDGDKENWINHYKGYKYITKVKKSNKLDEDKYTDKVRKLPEGNIEYFEKIVDLCNKNNIKLVLISTPTQVSWNYPRHNAAFLVAEKYNLEFIDLNLDNPLNIDWTKETKDRGGHVNYLGARKVSAFIGEYLKKSNLIEDHRNDPKYEDWNKAYEEYKKDLETLKK